MMQPTIAYEPTPPAAQFKYLRIEQVMEITALSRSVIYRKMAAGDFPQKVDIGGGSVRWVDYEVYQWNRQRLFESRGGAA